MLCFNLSVLSAFADCTISSNINASTWSSSSYSSCSGIISIPAGVTLNINADLTLPSSVTELIIEDGGRIQFSGGKKLYLNASTVLTIENTSITDPQDPTSAIYAPNPGGGACNNNTAIYLGTLKYSACVGGGNVCLIFDRLIEQGGSMKVQVDAFVDGIELSNNILCTSSPENNTFTLNSNITQSSQLTTPPSYNWSVLSSPIGSPSPLMPISTDSVVNVTTYAPGNYVFLLTITQNLSTTGCSTALTQIKTVEVPLNVVANPVPTISGDVTLVALSNPTTYAQIKLGGADLTQDYSITYTLNGVEYDPVTTTGGIFEIEVADTEDVGEYLFEIIKISNGSCEVEPSGVVSKVTIISEPLHMQLVDFESHLLNNCQAEINWKLASIDNLLNLSLEKSNDGKLFNTIFKSTHLKENRLESFIDNKLNDGLNIYRLKIEDNTGNSLYSQSINLQSNCPIASNAYAYIEGKNQLIIKGIAYGSRIIVNAIDGRIIHEMTSNNDIEVIPLQNVSDGVYIINLITTSGNSQQIKVIK